MPNRIPVPSQRYISKWLQHPVEGIGWWKGLWFSSHLSRQEPVFCALWWASHGKCKKQASLHAVVMGRNTAATGISNSPSFAQRSHLVVAWNQPESHCHSNYWRWRRADNTKLPLYPSQCVFLTFLFLFPIIQESEVKSLVYMAKPRSWKVQWMWALWAHKVSDSVAFSLLFLDSLDCMSFRMSQHSFSINGNLNSSYNLPCPPKHSRVL